MKLVGSYKLNVKKEIVWNALNNPEILKKKMITPLMQALQTKLVL